MSNLSRRSDDDVESLSSESFSPEDLAHSEVRQQWLAHVGEILVDVPDIEPIPEPSSLGTNVHSLAPRSKRLKMLLLQEVREVVKVHSDKPPENFNTVLKKFYPVNDSLEKGFMAHRDVPQAIITEVHPGNLLHVFSDDSAEEGILRRGSRGGRPQSDSVCGLFTQTGQLEYFFHVFHEAVAQWGH